MKLPLTREQAGSCFTKIVAGLTGLILGSLVASSLILWSNISIRIVGGP
jgi:hypothetical protein